MSKREYKIVVHYDLASYHPDQDWVAYDDLTYSGEPDDKIGYGKTPREAIDNLLDALDME
jgi:predicted RNase H-like HicB family nuclease